MLCWWELQETYKQWKKRLGPKCTLSLRFLSLAVVLSTGSKHLWTGVCVLIVVDSVEQMQELVCVVWEDNFWLLLCWGVGEAFSCVHISAFSQQDDLWQVSLASSACLDFLVYKMRMLIAASVRGDMELLKFRAQTCPRKALMKLIFNSSEKGK